MPNNPLRRHEFRRASQSSSTGKSRKLSRFREKQRKMGRRPAILSAFFGMKFGLAFWTGLALWTRSRVLANCLLGRTCCLVDCPKIEFKPTTRWAVRHGRQPLRLRSLSNSLWVCDNLETGHVCFKLRGARSTQFTQIKSNDGIQRCVGKADGKARMSRIVARWVAPPPSAAGWASRGFCS